MNVIDIEEKDKRLVASAALCQGFKSSEMYTLLDDMMEALELVALDALSKARSSNKDDIYALTVRWQERKAFRQAIKDEIDTNIADAQVLLQDLGLDPDEWQLRSVIENG